MTQQKLYEVLCCGGPYLPCSALSSDGVVVLTAGHNLVLFGTGDLYAISFKAPNGAISVLDRRALVLPCLNKDNQLLNTYMKTSRLLGNWLFCVFHVLLNICY